MGHSGPIPVVRGCPETQPLNNAFISAAREAGYAVNPNYNSGTQEGFCALQRNTRNGKRGDVYEGYLKPALKRPNLTIVTGARAERLVIQSGVARGVEYRLGKQLKRVDALREILLTAGSLASPQLLELSGIGDPDVLNRNRIEVKQVLPGVGNNLHTHPTIKLTYDCQKPASIYPATRFPGRWFAGLEWLFRRTGPAATNHFEAGAFLKTSPALDRPDIELTFLPMVLDGMTRSRQGHGFQVYVELIGCKSRGSTHISSADISDQPSFQFNYLAQEEDLVAYQASISLVRDLISQRPFAEYVVNEASPGVEVDNNVQIKNWLRHNVGLSHHLVGSCRMGSRDDADTVVGPDLKVHGIERLRIADASIMPRVTSGNTHAATIMIAERASDMIRSG
ncbi:MAG: choline dehydrogenase [Gammaproteobacteria bacterium]|nr:choline dehydrogenase [Gammaproteobacteria bacterium]